jgi:hypothetical protein
VAALVGQEKTAAFLTLPLFDFGLRILSLVLPGSIPISFPADWENRSLATNQYPHKRYNTAKEGSQQEFLKVLLHVSDNWEDFVTHFTQSSRPLSYRKKGGRTKKER